MKNFLTFSRVTLAAVAAVALVATLAAVPAHANSTCCRDFGEAELTVMDNGRSVVQWNPIVESYSAMVLTISGPCGTIERRYPEGKTLGFSLEEVSPDNPDGVYTWQIRMEPKIDPKVADMLAEARGTSEEEETFKSLRREGMLPEGPFLQTGSFSVVRGEIVDPGSGEEKGGLRASMPDDGATAVPGAELGVIGAGGAGAGNIGNVTGEQVISGDLTVYNSLCVGFDCLSNETYGADTIRLKENNLRIHVEDTSSAASFPTTDWRLEFNSNLNGGASYFRVIDVSANRNIMTIEANAPSHSLYVDNNGDLGVGTANPVLELHAVSGDTPGLRLEQDNSSGFSPQTWDLAGNETSFFLRDATNGSTLPFRVRPGASSNALVIDEQSEVGIGTLSPEANLHITEAGATRYRLENTSAGTEWDATNDGNGDFTISLVGSGGSELEIEQDGDIGNCGNPDHDLVISTGPGCTTTPRSWIDAGDSSFTTTSSRTYKENLEPVRMTDILAKIRQVPVYEYDFIDGPSDRIGLMAEDFHQIFGRGSDEELSAHEMQIAMWLAIQQLDQRDAELADKNAELELLKGRLATIEQMLEEISATR